MLIETKHADLSTLSVTIQALHVSGKQMTLAVFRQLPNEEEYDPEDVTHWGKVLYAIKDEGAEWIVYSEEGHLYRRLYREFRVSYHAKVHKQAREGLDRLRQQLDQAQKCKDLPAHTGEFYMKEYNRLPAEIVNAEEMVRVTAETVRSEQEQIAIERTLWNSLPQLFIAV